MDKGRTRKIVKDKKKSHDVVDKTLSEQQFRNWTQLPLLCENSGAIFLVILGLTAGSLAGWQAGRQTKYW